MHAGGGMLIWNLPIRRRCPGKGAQMSTNNSGWVRRQTAVLLSATLILSPVMTIPALAAETGDDAPIEQSQDATTGEQDVEQDENNGTVDADAENDVEPTGESDGNAAGQTLEDGDGDDAAKTGAVLTSAPRNTAPENDGVIPQETKAVSMTQDGGETGEYESISEALTEVQAYDSKTNKGVYTITLNQNVTEDVVIPEGVNVTIDLAGHTLTNKSGHTITNNSTRTKVVDSVGSGVVDNVTHGRGAIYNNINASITLSGGAYQRSAEASTNATDAGGNSWYVLKNFGTMMINENVTVRFSELNPGYYSSLIGNGWQNSSAAEAGNSGEPKPSDGGNKATLTIKGGSFVGGKITVKNDDYGVLKVSGGSIAQSTDSYYAIYNANDATISGGTIMSKSDAVGSQHYDGDANKGTLTVSGGSITSEDGDAVSLLTGATGTIKGGTFTTGNGRYAINVDDSSSATISAGTFVGTTADKVVNKDESFADRYGVAEDGNGNLIATVTDAQATVTAPDGPVTNYESLSKALSNAPAGSVVKLQEDVDLASAVSTKNYGVTLDLNGHNVTSTVTGQAAIQLKTNYGSDPVEGVDSTMRLINSVPGAGGTVTAEIPLGAKAGNSQIPLALEVGAGVALSPTDPNSDSVKLESSAYLKYSDQAASYIKNGGFKVSGEDGERIYGAYANAVAGSSDNVVTMLHDYIGSEIIYSGDHRATLDLDGHTYTYTGSQSIADVNYDSASLTIKNGILKATGVADGIQMLMSGSSLVLDDVTVEVPHGEYGIVTNGLEKDNSITLTNSTLTVDAGAGLYFPSTGSVLIDNSVITADATGVQLCAGSLTVRGDKTAITVTGQPETKTEGDGVIADGAAISVVKRNGYQELGSVNIVNGTFTSAAGVNAIKAYVFDNSNKDEQEWSAAGDVIAVSGGSFSTPVPENLCADGLEPVTDTDGKHTVGVAQDNLVTVSDADGNVVSAYETLAGAIDAASEGQTVTLLKNVTESVTIPEGAEVTLDLAGHTLTNTDGKHTITVSNTATLNVIDSSDAKTGAVDNVSNGCAALSLEEGSQAVLDGGTFKRSQEAGTLIPDAGNGNSYYTILNHGDLTINEGATVELLLADGSPAGYSSIIDNGWFSGAPTTEGYNAKLTINGGTLNGGKYVKNDSYGTMVVNGGQIINGAAASVLNWNTATINGGTFDPSDSADGAIYNLKDRVGAELGSVDITGGTFVTSGDQRVVFTDAPGTANSSDDVEVSGGTYKGNAPDDAYIVPGSGLTKNDDGTYGIHEHVAQLVAAKDPTCTEAGNRAYYVCSTCHELFSDAEMTQPTTIEAVTLAATGHQHVTHTEAVEPTETTAGTYEYWHCADCDKYFSDQALTHETTLAALTRPALGREPVETHTVTFDYGTGAPSTTVTVADGEAVPRPADPTYEGWTFAGWFTDDGTFKDAYDFSAPVTGDLTLYAGWYKVVDDTTPETPETPTTPTTGNGGTADKAGDKADKGTDALAKTGDPTSVAPIAVAAAAGVAAVGAAAATRRRRRE